ncbi:MAG: alpha/beta hydrolase, partial [Pseudomonadota bacterium]
FAEIETAYEADDLDLACELETQVWFDGDGREASQVDAAARARLFAMNRRAIGGGRNGERQPDLTPSAAERLGEISVPTLILTGALDIPYIQAAAEVMRDGISHSVWIEYPDAAHLPNMEHPDRFNDSVGRFLQSL